MKDRELKLVSELFKNSDRSDRELGKVLGTSQPTISRMLKRLKEEGVIKEHTIIADFRKLGIELMAITFGAWSPEKIKDYSEDERVEKAKRFLSEHPNVIFASSGQGLGKGRVVITLHKNYTEYNDFMKQAKSEWAGLVKLESFIISLEADVAPIPFSFRNLGKYLGK
ncbi:MAG TPA: Lrp/AsnC family transcriptional regulator [Candidatus Bathyarchaeia archaeon]|nr:Lrp/AsnC family transcriptional regulator [Candidatus Bathyarchaeia archaeon]